jgi:hypothetical protein
MGNVIRFPDVRGGKCGDKHVDADAGSATIIILPVIRIDRDPDGESGSEAETRRSGRRRRRRIAR